MPAFRSFVVASALAVALAAPFLAPGPAHATTTPIKVALIVGPTGSGTAENRSQADAIAAQAVALGATVTKAYSPNATYAKVRAAVAGANIIVYMGHGNGFPNPYGTTLWSDREDGWGLNTTTTHGDADSWSAGTMVYCGEKALAGQLTASDGVNQRTYCAGAIAPAAGFVMVYIGACYTAGNNESGTAAATNSDARLHLAYYSRPVLTTLHGSGYFAGQAAGVIPDLIQHPDRSYGDIWADSEPSGLTGAYAMPHALVSGASEWLTRQTSAPYWYYAFAGNPARTFSGGTSTFAPPTGSADFAAPRMKAHSPAAGGTGVSTSTKVTVTFSEAVQSVSNVTITLWRGTQVSASVVYNATTHTATLTPKVALAKGVTYTVKVSATIRDMAGNRITAASWWFATVH